MFRDSQTRIVNTHGPALNGSINKEYRDAGRLRATGFEAER